MSESDQGRTIEIQREQSLLRRFAQWNGKLLAIGGELEFPVGQSRKYSETVEEFDGSGWKVRSRSYGAAMADFATVLY